MTMTRGLTMLLLLSAASALQLAGPAVGRAGHARSAAIMGASPKGRRPSRVGQVFRAELSEVIRSAHNAGAQKIPTGLQQLISVVDVDMSPDLRNANVKVSIIGDRKDKITAVRWLRGNVRGLRHELAQRNRGRKVIPTLTFNHVDVGAAADMMVMLDALKREREEREAEEEEQPQHDDDVVDAEDEDAWLEDEDEDDWLDDDDDALEDAWLEAEGSKP